jgi:hypothetical protein
LDNNFPSTEPAAAVGTGSGFGRLGLPVTQRQIGQWLLGFILAIVLLIHSLSPF